MNYTDLDHGLVLTSYVFHIEPLQNYVFLMNLNLLLCTVSLFLFIQIQILYENYPPHIAY